VTEKCTLAALCAAVVGLLMLFGFSIFLDIRWERAWIWIPSIFLAGFGLASAGVAIGASLRDVRAASLVAFMIGLPLAAAALVPTDAVGSVLGAVIAGVSALFPFQRRADAGRRRLATARAPDRDHRVVHVDRGLRDPAIPLRVSAEAGRPNPRN
jgi:hypothetical protein